MFSVLPTSHQREQPERDREEHRHHDREGMHEGLELRGEHDVDEGEREHEGDHEVLESTPAAACPARSPGCRTPGASAARRRRQGFAERLRQGLGGQEVRDDRDRALLGVALDLARAHALPEVRDVGELDQRAARARHRERGQAGGVRSVLSPEAQPDVVLLAGLPVEAHLLAADHRAERGRDGVHAHAEVRGFAAVDVHLDLGLPQRLRGVEVDEAALGLEGLDDLARVLLEPGQVRGRAGSG